MGIEHNPNSRWYNFVYMEDIKSSVRYINLTGIKERESAIIIQRWWKRMKNNN
jgi:hypothetical protein